MAMLARFTPAAAAGAGGGGAGTTPAGGAASTSAATSATSTARGSGVCSKCGEVPAAECVTVRLAPLCRHCLLATTQARLKGALIAGPGVGRPIALSLTCSAACAAVAALLNKLSDFGRRPRFFASVAAIHVDVGRVGTTTTDGVPPTPLSAAAAEAVTLALQQRLSVVVVPLEAAFADDGVVDAAGWAVVGAAAPVEAPAAERLGRATQTADGMAPSLPPSAPSVVDGLASVQAAAGAAWVGAAWDAARSRMDAAFRSAAASRDGADELLAACVSALAATTAARCRVAALVRCDTVDAAATAILRAVCTGRGEGIPLLAAPVDASWSGGGCDAPAIDIPSNWYSAPVRPPPPAAGGADGSGVLVLRPFLEVEAAELELYCDAAGLPAYRRVPRERDAVPASIAAATADLLAGLQASFGNSVHNVVRTAGKLAVPSHGAGATAFCALCRALLPAATPAATAAAAAAAHEVGISPTPPRLLHTLCRGCLLSRKAAHAHGGSAVDGVAADVDVLPSHALTALSGRLGAGASSEPARRAALRAHIADWLLADDSEGDA